MKIYFLKEIMKNTYRKCGMKNISINEIICNIFRINVSRDIVHDINDILEKEWNYFSPAAKILNFVNGEHKFLLRNYNLFKDDYEKYL